MPTRLRTYWIYYTKCWSVQESSEYVLISANTDSAKKSQCGFSTELRQGLWNFSPKFFEKILSLSKPKYCHEAVQLVYLANWLSTNIPKLAELKKPFADFENIKGRKLVDVEKDM
eukprot:snap_masked-scaffold_23-processed-gene-0.33-mRNA-1 protein AED:1.00 eAED:1.00 QI:0/-1/0/0/-1/1/1/0/114